MKNIKLILFILSVLVASFVRAQENQIQVSSTITHATVFLNGAQIQRQSEVVNLPQGVSKLVFSGLSATLDAQSLQAKGEGSFTILAVTKERNFLQEKKNSEEKNKLIATVLTLNDNITKLKNESDIYKAEEEMLSKNQTVMGPNVNYDLAKLKLALDFQKQRLTEAKNKQIDINNSIKKLQEEAVKYQKQINEIDGQSLKNSSDVVVKVSTKTATKAKFILSYLVKDANWYPTYDIRAKDVSSPIELVYKANVSQSSGEDWNNVKLTLSTGNPTTTHMKPELEPYQLGFISAGYYGTGKSSAIRFVKGRVTESGSNLALSGVSIRVNNSSVATVTDGNGNYSLQVPIGANELNFVMLGYQQKNVRITSSTLNVSLNEDVQMLYETAVAKSSAMVIKESVNAKNFAASATTLINPTPLVVTATENQTNVTFDIENPYNILSDGKQFTVAIGNYNFNADYEYYAAPKLSAEAFLTAKITGFNDVKLISGETNIFFEGTFLGKSIIDVQSASDTLTFSLGVDKNVIVSREKQKDFNEKQLIGSSQRDNRFFVIDIKNRKSQAINLIIQDQLPVATSSDITIEKQDISKASLDEATGILTWKLNLKPNEQQKLNLKYQVKYPKNKPVNIE